MRKLMVGLAGAAAVALVGCSPAARPARSTVEPPHLVSMTDSAQALQRVGTVMQSHGQTMLAEGQRTGDQDLVAHAEHWLRDGQALVQRGQWLAMDPLAPSSLITSPSELSEQKSWGELPRTAAAMLHDPSQAREIDLEALRWNGLAMRAEGQIMVDHGRLMAEEIELMVARHGLSGQTSAELREAVQAMQVTGGHLTGNGQAMIDYADRLRQSLGYG